jgi:hypothetical protein
MLARKKLMEAANELITVIARSKGGRTPTASRQASRHEKNETKADVTIITQTGVRWIL